MTHGMARREEIEYVKLLLIVTSIVSAGKIASGQDPGDSLRNMLKNYKSLAFPELESDLLAKAKQHEKILEKEFSQGPLKVKPLHYGKRRKKR